MRCAIVGHVRTKPYFSHRSTSSILSSEVLTKTTMPRPRVKKLAGTASAHGQFRHVMCQAANTHPPKPQYGDCEQGVGSVRFVRRRASRRGAQLNRHPCMFCHACMRSAQHLPYRTSGRMHGISLVVFMDGIYAWLAGSQRQFISACRSGSAEHRAPSGLRPCRACEAASSWTAGGSPGFEPLNRLEILS